MQSYFSNSRSESCDLLRSVNKTKFYEKNCEISELKTQNIVNQQELLLAIETIHNDVNVLLKKTERAERLDDLISYGNNVWDKSTGEGPLVTIRRIASTIKVGQEQHTVMGWICKNQNGKYLELPEEALSTKKVEVQQKVKVATKSLITTLIFAISVLANIIFIFN